jgi:hypothetical protein
MQCKVPLRLESHISSVIQGQYISLMRFFFGAAITAFAYFFIAPIIVFADIDAVSNSIFIGS